MASFNWRVVAFEDEDLKRASFTVGATFTERQVCSPRFPALFVNAAAVRHR